MQYTGVLWGYMVERFNQMEEIDYTLDTFFCIAKFEFFQQEDPNSHTRKSVA